MRYRLPDASRLGFNSRRTVAGSRSQQRGISILAVIVMLLVFAFMAISMDTGRLWLERRSLQKTADMAALASARFTGCGGSLTAVQSAALRSVLANGFSESSMTVAATHGVLASNAAHGWTYTPVATDKDGIRAAQVTVTKQIRKSLVLGGLFTDNKDVTLTATATAKGGPPIATYSMDGSMLTIDTPFTRGMNTLLESVFTRPVNLGASVFQQLSASSISLDDLRKAGNFATIEDMLNSDNSVGWLLQTYSLAAAEGDTQGAAALSELIQAIGPSNLHLKLSDVLKLNTGDKEALLDARINLLELVKVSVTVGARNSGRMYDIPVEVPGVTMRMQFNDIPQIAVGPGGKSADTGAWCTSSKSTEAMLSFSIGNGPFQQLLSLFTLGTLKTDIKFKFLFGNAEARLNYIDPTPGAAKVQYSVNTSPFTMSITNNAEDGDGFVGVQLGTAKFGVGLGNFGDSVKKLEANVLVPKVPDGMATPIKRKLIPGSSEFQGTLAGMLNSIPVPYPVIGNPNHLFAKLLENIVKTILEPVLDIVMNVVGTLLANTIDPLMRAVGIHFGSADVMLYDMRTIPPELISVKTATP